MENYDHVTEGTITVPELIYLYGALYADKSKDSTQVVQRVLYEAESVSSPRNRHGELMLQSNPYWKNEFNMAYTPAVSTSTQITRYLNYSYVEGKKVWYCKEVLRKVYGRKMALSTPISDPKTDYTPQPGNVAYDQAATRFYTNVAGIQINVIQALAERQQTVNLIVANLKKIGKALFWMRKGHFAEAAKELGINKGQKISNAISAANFWLELQFGWKPLLMDITGAIDAVNKTDPIIRIKATGKHIEKEKLENFPATYEVVSEYACTMKALGTINVSRYKASQLGAGNPFLTAWELVPFSFLVDYVLPIGAWLEAHQPIIGIDLYDESVTTSVKRNVKMTNYDVGADFSYVQNSTSGGVTCGLSERIDDLKAPDYRDRITQKKRVTELPKRPSLHFKNPISVGHALNVLALLTSNSKFLAKRAKATRQELFDAYLKNVKFTRIDTRNLK